MLPRFDLTKTIQQAVAIVKAVSNECVPSKIMEQTVSNAVIDHIPPCNMTYYVNISGRTRSGCSTEMLIVDMTEKWRSALDQRKVIGAWYRFPQNIRLCVVLYPVPLQTQELWHYG